MTQKDKTQTDIDALAAAADALADLVQEGECPWRDDTSKYREWYQDRAEAAARYRAAREAVRNGTPPAFATSA